MYKDETLDYIKIYKAEAKNQLERKNKHLRSNHGGEFFSKLFEEFCGEHVIIHERTPSYSLESNGIAKRRNHTLTGMVTNGGTQNKPQEHNCQCSFHPRVFQAIDLHWEREVTLTKN